MLYTTVAVALLGASAAYAAPASSSGKTTFTVTTIPKANHHKNIYAAMHLLNLKYGNKTSIAHSKRQDGTVVSTPDGDGDQEYTAPVTIGGQTLHLDFDTGSSDLWTFSDLQPSSQTAGHTIFSRAKSSTYKALQGYTFNIGFGDQSGASGIVGTDTVTIGSSTVKGQAIELAKTVSSEFVTGKNDGLVGLGYGSGNQVQPNQQKTFFENLAPSLESPLFAASLKHQAPGSYDFGFIDSKKYTGSLQYTTIDPSNGWYEFPSTQYSVGSQSFSNQDGQTGIADTGTTVIALSSDTVSNYYAAVQGATFDSTNSVWTYPCSSTLPDFTFNIGDTPVTIPASELLWISENGTCAGGIQPKPDGITQDIYGDVFFKAFYVVFDVGNSRIGYAPHA